LINLIFVKLWLKRFALNGHEILSEALNHEKLLKETIDVTGSSKIVQSYKEFFLAILKM
jgi:hypothetical protein